MLTVGAKVNISRGTVNADFILYVSADETEACTDDVQITGSHCHTDQTINRYRWWLLAINTLQVIY